MLADTIKIYGFFFIIFFLQNWKNQNNLNDEKRCKKFITKNYIDFHSTNEISIRNIKKNQRNAIITI